MEIRAITFGQIIPYLYDDNTLISFMHKKLDLFSHFNAELSETFEDEDIKVQSRRICSQPLFSYEEKRFHEQDLNKIIPKLKSQFQLLLDLFKDYQIDYFACCAMLAHQLRDFGVFEKLLLDEIPTYLKNFDNLFSSLPVASTVDGINLAALKAGAKIIKSLSSPDPFDNLKFCVSSNIKSNNSTPFFPASYHFSDDPGFSIAIEMADELVDVCNDYENLTQLKRSLSEKLNRIYDRILEIVEPIAEKYDIQFKGIDFSPAPFPEYGKSIGTVVEKMGFQYFGSHGATLAVAMIKNAIPKNKEKIIGFSGFMQPVLEDYTIAKRLSENKFNLDTLLLYSTICGTGLDCIPLPGDITEKELFFILLDICTISLKLQKPLTARLMPIPGKKAGDDVDFNFEYFSPSKIIDYRKLDDKRTDDLYHRIERFFNPL
ncbi:MAG: DUF711 family protein [Candidatus Lokiarchaeota archaeon]|nr:DUF711 family protein [Candidatus Lokiarchaeota archaeon]MBD3200643.1 DUF711 family protein [Candidatus Lokiarchaeota archaeon]